MSGFVQRVLDLKSQDDMTSFIWEVGRLRSVSFGCNIMSTVVRVGLFGQYRLNFFPKGFTDPDYASLYISDVDCELKGKDQKEPEKITQQSFATVIVKMVPIPRPDEDATAKPKPAKAEQTVEEPEDDEGTGSVESKSTVPSKKAEAPAADGQKAPSRSGSKGSKGSKRSGGAAAAAAPAGAPGAPPPGTPGKAPPAVPIIRELSQQFTNVEPKWGFEKMFDIGKMYSWKEGYLNDYGEGKTGTENKDKVQDGFIRIEVTILAVSNIRTEDPINEPKVTPDGRMRTTWVIHDFRRLTQKIPQNKKLCSSPFENDGKWYFQLYPNGYLPKGTANEDKPFISLFLHSTPKQVGLGLTLKQSFRLGIKRYNPADEKLSEAKFDLCWFPKQYIGEDKKEYPWGSTCVALFDPTNKCFGKRLFLPISIFSDGFIIPKAKIPGEGKDDKAIFGSGVPPLEKASDPRQFVSGDWASGGSVGLVLEMLVTDIECRTVQHMLHEIEVFGHKQDKCQETNEPLDPGVNPKVICYECGKAYSKEATQYQARLEEYGYEIGREYILDILMREEPHWIDNVVKSFNVAEWIDGQVQKITKQIERFNRRKVAASADSAGSSANKELEDKRRRKEQLKQDQFVKKMDQARKEVEDAFFSKPVCSKCASSRRKLTHYDTPVVYASQPPDEAKRESVEGQGEERKASKWIPPDQNAITSKYIKGKPRKVNVRNVRTPSNQFEVEWDKGVQPKKKPEPPAAAAGAPGAKPGAPGAAPAPAPADDDDDKKKEDPKFWVGNFRYRWKENRDLFYNKFKEMEMTFEESVQINKAETRVLHAKDDWIFKRLSKKQQAEKPGESYEDRKIRVAKEGVARNAMTLVRGNRFVEPLELSRFCAGRTNEDGYLPEEEEDAPFDGFCDVRFDVLTEPRKQFHCLWSGKVFCEKCCSYSLALPEFEKHPAEAEPKPVCHRATLRRGEAKVRLQDESKKPEEPPLQKRAVVEEEPDEPPDNWEEARYWVKKHIPVCGRDIAKAFEGLEAKLNGE